MDTVEFDVENFVKFVEQKHKNKKNVHIEIWYNLDLLNEDVIDLNASIFRGIEKRLSEYFEYLGRAYSHLRIGFAGVDGYCDFSLDKIKPQKRILPIRAATKRNYK
uniref:Uncharacterized protein n=1 Tax=Panagrolaimus davidi TaxID=227884 RepID=A0A914QBL3_9BILA